jgi:hypothetical protein
MNKPDAPRNYRTTAKAFVPKSLAPGTKKRNCKRHLNLNSLDKGTFNEEMLLLTISKYRQNKARTTKEDKTRDHSGECEV